MKITNTPNFTEDWFSGNIPVWEQNLKPLKEAKQKLRFLEIGCFEGRATRWLLENIMKKGDTIDVVDTFAGSTEHEAMKVKLEGMKQRFLHNIENSPNVIIHQGFSENILRKDFGKENEIFDFIYIDGDHHSKSVLGDAVFSFPLLKKGGYLVFDDYRWRAYKRPIDNPWPGINAFIGVWEDDLTIIHEGYQLILRKL